MSSTDGQLTWPNALAWADALEYGGFDDWRLPSALNFTGTGPSPCFGYCAGSELGHMFFVNLQGNAGQSILDAANKPNLALFTNLQPGEYGSFWTGTQLASSDSNVYAMVLYQWAGYQTSQWSHDSDQGPHGVNPGQAWAVRNGDVAAIPEPTALSLMLAGAAFMGLLQLGRARRN